jgi:hypothetical protein
VRRRRKRSWPRPQLVHGLPHRPVDGHVLARHSLGRRGRVSAPSANGWREIFPRQEPQVAAASAEPRCGPTQLPHIRKIPTELRDRCFNRLSYSHRVATCRLPWRCLRCHEFHHLTRDCKRPRRSARSMAKGGDLSRHSARGNTPPASARGDPPCSDGAAQSAVGGTGGIRQRRW